MKHKGKTISTLFNSRSIDSLAKLVPSLSGILAAGEDNEEILQIAKTTVSQHWESLSEDLDIGEYVNLAAPNGLDVIRASVSEIKVTSGCIHLQMLVFGVPKGNEYSFEEEVSPKGFVISGVKSDSVVRVTLNFIEDVINKVTVSFIGYTLILKASDPVPLIPTGTVTMYESVPTTLVTSAQYGKIPAGTKMYLDFESMLFRDQDMKHPGGIPADIVVNLWNFAAGEPNPTSELFEVNDLCVGRDEADIDEMLGTGDEDDDEEDEEESDLERDLRNLTAFQVATEGVDESVEELPDSFWENLNKEEDN